jgi:hypothetical protein
MTGKQKYNQQQTVCGDRFYASRMAFTQNSTFADCTCRHKAKVEISFFSSKKEHLLIHQLDSKLFDMHYIFMNLFERL